MKKNSIEKVNIKNETEYMYWCSKLKVWLIGNQYSSLIDQHNQQIEKRMKQDSEKYKEKISFNLKYQENTAVLNINVSKKQKNRAYTFMDYFMEAVQALGGSVKVDMQDKDNTIIKFPYCTFECSLTEIRCKYRNAKPVEHQTMKPLYDLVDTCKLRFNIIAVDEKGKTLMEFIYKEDDVALEDQIDKIFINLRPIFLEISNKNEEIERIHKKENEERIKQYQLKCEKEKEEEKRKKYYDLRVNQQGVIEQHIEKWEHVKEIESYVKDIRTNAEKQTNSAKECMKRYCDYVEDIFSSQLLFEDIIKFTQDL